MARLKSKASGSSRPVWSHGGDSLAQDAELCVAYCAGRDVQARPMADASLIPFDLQTNRAHCAMLCRTGIISRANLAAIEEALTKIERRHARGEFVLDPALEDVHINIERTVARIAGEEAAGVMHTARSRNDQTATDIRLWIRSELLRLTEAVAGALESIAKFATKHGRTVMAGWTHGQPAMPTTLGHWACGHGFPIARDLAALKSLWPLINESPLGSAAGFGTSWPIDRKQTAAWLGFDAPQANSLDAVSTRWEAESRLGSALAILMTHFSSLAQDLYFLSSPPRRLVDLDGAFTTGSSIMPQKRNPDFAEVTRARAASVQSLVGAMLAAGRGALSGYNRDSQWTKYWVMDLVDEVGEAPRVFARVMETLKPKGAELEKTAHEEFVSAVDLADHLAASRKVEFRRIYHVVGRSVAADLQAGVFRLETVNAMLEAEKIHPPMTAGELKQVTEPKTGVFQRKSIGSPNPVDTAAQAKDLGKLAVEARGWCGQKRKGLTKAEGQLRDAIAKLIV